jgi:uncharacterized protein (TIGR03790 family)
MTVINNAIVLAISLLFAGSVTALEPKEIFLLVNKNLPASKEVAEYYCKQRGVPAGNIILLDVPTTEDINRKDYNAKIVEPVRAALKGKKDQARVLLSIYGVPLRVGGPEPSPEEREQIKKLDAEIKTKQAATKVLQDATTALEKTREGLNLLEIRAFARAQRELLARQQAEITGLNRRRGHLAHAESQACVDSELMLLWWDKYELRRWVVNPLYWQMPKDVRDKAQPVVLTCRLDGPTPAIAKRLVDDSIATEKKGLEGKVYVDARGIRYDPKGDSGFGYGGYDESMREMAALLEKEGKLSVVLDDKNELFKPNACPECALYCGWYSLANFIDSCRFVKGAIAWHLASSEAVSLRQPDVKYWCKNLLEKGACATLGPVAEPYTVGFPKPAEFFGTLATGKYTLVESYGRTIILISWMGCLVGDPLYNPFGKNPCLKEEHVQQSPKGGRFTLNAK